MPYGQTVTAAELQERWPAVMEEIRQDGEEVVITDEGQPVAKVVALDDPVPRTLESLRQSVIFLGDVDESTADEWEEGR